MKKQGWCCCCKPLRSGPARRARSGPSTRERRSKGAELLSSSTPTTASRLQPFDPPRYRYVDFSCPQVLLRVGVGATAKLTELPKRPGPEMTYGKASPPA